MARRTLVKKSNIALHDDPILDMDSDKNDPVYLSNTSAYYPTDTSNNLFFVRYWYKYNSLIVNDVHTEAFSLIEKFHHMSWAGHCEYNVTLEDVSPFDAFVIYVGY